MSNKNKAALAVAAGLTIVLVAIWRLHSVDIPVLEPRGIIAQKERRLIITALLLSLVVVIPVYAMLIGFAWKYREGNTKARYEPDFDHSRLIESVWWGVPLILITILAIITWRSSHELDPFKALASSTPPLTIQAVSLEWKWLFIYPQQNIASVNLVQLPVNTPINFEITSDAPMNSFWIPQLGGQIYAMSGMSTQLHLMASQTGNYWGESANISGTGFAGMHFIARASSAAAFDQWVNQTKKNPEKMDLQTYAKLSTPSQNDPVRYYGAAQNGLFNQVVSKYEAPVYFTASAESP